MSNPIELKDIVNGAIANISAALVLFVLGLLFLDNNKILKPWLYKYGSKLSKGLVDFFIFLIKIIADPIFRIILAGVFLVLINYKGGDLIYSLLVIFILWSFLWKSKRKSIFLPSPKISDGFEELNSERWKIKTGNPIIENSFGKPAPDLGLSVFSEIRTDSFIILKERDIEQGVIECDFYLEDNAIFNIVFFADDEKDAWYMARYDSRGHYSDGFLIKNPEKSWEEFKMSGTKTTIKKWHRARIEFNSTKVSMFSDDNLIMEFSNPNMFGKKIGMFNEINFVHVDNFSLTEMK